MRYRTDRQTSAQIVTRIAIATLCILKLGSTPLRAAEVEGSLLSNTAQQLLDQDFEAARESIKRATVATRSGKTKELQESVIAVAAMPECLIAPFRDRIGQEVSVPFPQGADLVRITGVDEEGRIKAEKLLKVDAKVVGTTPRDFALSDLDAGERFKLLGRDESPERQIMRGLLAWEAGRADAAKNFFAKSKNDLGKLLIARVDQVVKDRLAADAREQNATQEAAAAKAYEAMLKTAGVQSMRDDSDKMIAAIRKKRFSEAEAAQISGQLSMLTGNLAKTQIAGEVQPVLKCFALVRPNFALEVDQATLDKAIAKLNKDNPKELITAAFDVGDGKLCLALKNHHALVDLTGLTGLPITHLKIENCRSLADLTPLQGMPLRELTLSTCMSIRDISPLKGMPLQHLYISGYGMSHAHKHVLLLTDLTALEGMPLETVTLRYTDVENLGPLKEMKLKELNLSGCGKIRDLSPLKGMPLERLNIKETRISDLSPVKSIKGLEISR